MSATRPSSANVAVPMGTNVTVGGYNAEWAYVNLNGTLGFIRISDLSRTNYSTLQTAARAAAVESLETRCCCWDIWILTRARATRATPNPR